jgi:glycosyltransferase involved in cell wall biosynthesis
MPVFNGERYLAEAIESALGQTRPDLELIVVDDGSTDGSRAIAEGYDATYLRQERGGPGAARNLGVTRARGQFIAFLDHDDRWPPEKLAWQLDAFDGEPDADLVFGHVQNFVSSELDPEIAATIECPPDPLPGPIAGTLLIRTETLRSVGEFGAGDRPGAEFLDWLVLADAHSLRQVMLPQVLLFRRLHGSNLHRSGSNIRQDYVRALKAMLDQRRADGSA